ncbi:hypothetical protein CDES_04450 [Corynebacterium deserti GIMN1.010]|uniref:Putative zinc-finger domain-containing protein n=1 Tax=Corynebacterium deserti GIMN1.010 TaxID=931089 RepID=A0A0M4CKW2_9CORY|nr:zf-HC2 domain-containing protein [Corynebacterium deserti]ALC05335.1 hypothetical protein CDES_04450 [Corynebacterium deserti GIMN1.010]
MVDCGAIQAALSAKLDGEPTGLDDEVIDAHLSHCEDCRNFYNRAARLNRMINFCTAEPKSITPPDLSEIILAEVEPQWRRRANAQVIGSMLSRVALVVLGVVYVVWGMMMLGESTSISMQEDPLTSRLIAEAATFRVGLAVGLFFAAWQPRIIVGILPIFGTLWTFSVGLAARDFVIGVADSQTGVSIILLLVSTIVLTIGWLNSRGAGVWRRTWSSLNAEPA